ncbi:unnamed protein product [Phytophthora fragariaefolia]|uniref:Unnamed protein product n=1 Tax=Phytophthora fragariaefolia TaxID=1490495 RepID=A0A9W7D0N2_9STRA|nr:unnamed protein product [Phytophthora fragariaefolia]
MVKIFRSVALGAVIAAASLALVQAAPIGCNPVTNTDADNCNPQIASESEGTCEVTIPDDAQCLADEAGSESRMLRRLEDAANSDMTDLEKYLGGSLELGFANLKSKYSSASAVSIPWPSSYWPTYQDSINVIWKSGEASASEKYAKAYGLDATDFKNKISAKTGIDSRKSSTACTADTDCKSRNDGSVCAKRKDATSGYCIPTWYGICHAWSPAAILESEPKCDVVKNGQTFHVMDIKALLTDVYDGSSIKTVFTGARFNGPDTPANVDNYGRYKSDARRDLGAGFFHVAISNIMGKHKQSFVVDVVSGSQVWNQPVRSYDVETMELVDASEASLKYFGTSTYPFNSAMKYLAYVKTKFSWIVEAYADGPLVSTGKVDTYTVSNSYEYLLELDANKAILGGEWVGGSKEDHPDFLWLATAKPAADTVTSTGLSYANVQELLELSLSCGATSGSESESANASESASASASTSASASASTSASASASTSASASASTSATASASTSASASASTSASASSSTSASGSASAGAYTRTSTSTSTSASTSASASTSTSASTSASTASGTSEDASAASSYVSGDASAGTVETTSAYGEGSHEARSGSAGSVAPTPVGKGKGGKYGTTDATATYTSKSSTFSTEENIAASLPSGKDALMVTTSITGSTEEDTSASAYKGKDTLTLTTSSTSSEGGSTASLPSGKDAWAVTPSSTAPTTTVDEESIATTVTDSSSSSGQYTSSETTTQTSVHNSCK